MTATTSENKQQQWAPTSDPAPAGLLRMRAAAAAEPLLQATEPDKWLLLATSTLPLQPSSAPKLRFVATHTERAKVAFKWRQQVAPGIALALQPAPESH